MNHFLTGFGIFAGVILFICGMVLYVKFGGLVGEIVDYFKKNKHLNFGSAAQFAASSTIFLMANAFFLQFISKGSFDVIVDELLRDKFVRAKKNYDTSFALIFAGMILMVLSHLIRD